MGECCSNENYPEERKIFDSFDKMDNNNIKIFDIINYDENCEIISGKYRNNFEKMGQFQYLRVNFVKQMRRHILKDKDKYSINNNENFFPKSNYYRNNNYKFTMIRYNNISGTQKTLYYIIIMTLLLKNYLKRKYISNELEISLLELSVVIMNKNYNNKDLKLILFHLSKMFEILFPNITNIQNIINLKAYLSKINLIINDINILLQEEKYPFILMHIISLGEWFKNEYKTLLIDNNNRILLLKYYSYLFIQNYDFIVQNYFDYEKKIIMKNINGNNFQYIENYYNENDLIQHDKDKDIIYNKNNQYLNQISISIHYFFIICTEDIFTGKNIFNEFGNILNQEIMINNLQNDENIIKYKKSVYHILFINLLSNESSSTMILSFLNYIIEYQKLEINNSDVYYQMIIKLYGKFNNNRIFLDKYSTFICNIFVSEIEQFKNQKFIIDYLYNYINDLYIKNKYSNDEEGKINNCENIYFFVNLFKNISLYFNKQNNFRIINDILIYLNNFTCDIKRDYQKNIININKNNNTFLYENINITLKNFINLQNDIFSLEEKIQMSLSTFLSSYIIMINYICQIDFKDITIDFDKSIIYTITILEIKIIKYNKIKSLNNIIVLLNLLIKHLNSKNIIDYEEIINYLQKNLILMINQAYKSNIAHNNIQYTTFHLKLIYIIIFLILSNINKNNSEKEIFLSKHNKILLKINQYNKIIGSCFQNLSDINNIHINNFQNLLQGQIYAITNISFIQIINLYQNELFNNENENNINQNEQINFRSRTLYMNDKSSDMNININTKNDNLQYNTKTHLLNDNFIINDSFSKYSNDTFSFRKVNNKFISNYNFNNDIHSEKIIMPNKLNFNNQINIFNNINANEDVFSNQSSVSNFDVKI